MRADVEPPLDLTIEPTTHWKGRLAQLQILRSWVNENLERAYDTQAKYYNSRHIDVQFEVADKVVRRQRALSSAAQNFAAKLVPKFSGPVVITKK